MARGEALAMYRRLFRHVQLLPPPRKAAALAELREGFRKHAGESDARRVGQLLQEARSKLAFLRMLTPIPRSDRGGRSGRFVLRDGSLVEGAAEDLGAARHAAFSGANVDPDALARHRSLVERQHFGGRC
mmetsp:Transcript_9382/g.31780  ORF Transcript_9382/g.31780 Transcript_9382/m.31780 type:complete len:130 (+) Transcript_9382:35-424(+)